MKGVKGVKEVKGVKGVKAGKYRKMQVGAGSEGGEKRVLMTIEGVRWLKKDNCVHSGNDLPLAPKGRHLYSQARSAWEDKI